MSALDRKLVRVVTDGSTAEVQRLFDIKLLQVEHNRILHCLHEFRDLEAGRSIFAPGRPKTISRQAAEEWELRLLLAMLPQVLQHLAAAKPGLELELPNDVCCSNVAEAD